MLQFSESFKMILLDITICESARHTGNWTMKWLDFHYLCIICLLSDISESILLPVLTGICCWGWSTAVLPLMPSRGQHQTCSGLCSTGWICPAPPVWSCQGRIRLSLWVWPLLTAGPSPPSWDTAASTHSWTWETVRWKTAVWTCCFLSQTESVSGGKE